jgi:hypothetical protein
MAAAMVNPYKLDIAPDRLSFCSAYDSATKKFITTVSLLGVGRFSPAILHALRVRIEIRNADLVPNFVFICDHHSTFFERKLCAKVWSSTSMYKNFDFAIAH